MKKVYIFLILTFVYSEELNDSLQINTSKWGGGVSFGACTDKAPIGIVDLSIIKYINNHSEIYGAYGTLILSLNFGMGYRYYFNSRYESSFFIGTSLNAMIWGGGESTGGIRAVNLNFGRSIDVTDFFKTITSKGKKVTSSFLNLGLVLSYSDDYSQSNSQWKLMPLIAFESRIPFK